MNELTEEQLKVLDLYVRGFSLYEISNILHLTEKTIRKKLGSIAKKIKSGGAIVKSLPIDIYG